MHIATLSKYLPAQGCFPLQSSDRQTADVHLHRRRCAAAAWSWQRATRAPDST